MNKLIGLIGAGVVVLAFPAITAATSVNVNTSSNALATNVASASWVNSLWTGLIPSGANVNVNTNSNANTNTNTSIATGGNSTATAVAVAQQQQQQNGGNGDNSGQQQQQQDVSVAVGTSTNKNSGGVSVKVAQQQKQQQQVATVSGPTKTESGKLPSAGADVAIPTALATLGTSIAAYLKHKKQMLSLAFMAK